MTQLNLELPPEIRPEEMLFLAMKLFESGRLSTGQAAELAGYSKPAFMEILGKYGVPIINYPPGELKRETKQ